METCRSCLEQKDIRYQFPLTTTYRDRTIIELIQEVTNIKVSLFKLMRFPYFDLSNHFRFIRKRIFHRESATLAWKNFQLLQKLNSSLFNQTALSAIKMFPQKLRRTVTRNFQKLKLKCAQKDPVQIHYTQNT